MTTVTQLARRPVSPINQACDDWAATKGAYRLFANPKVHPATILAAHRGQTLHRMRAHPVVFAIQDTTYLNYSTHRKTVGLGHIGTAHTKQVQGLIMHTTLVVTRQGLPLGLLAQEIYTRPPVPRRSKAPTHKQIRIEDKESGRWLRALEATQAPSGVRIITLADREADIYEFLVRAPTLRAPFVLRAAWDRTIQGTHGCSISGGIWPANGRVRAGPSRSLHASRNRRGQPRSTSGLRR